MLLIGAGDGGPVVDPDADAQNRGNLLGKLLRIDVDRQEGGNPYAIPADNPLVAEPDARGEILVLGARNPWSWSIDPATAHIYLGDVGFAQWEEINIIPHSSGGGQNFGWPTTVGDDCLEPGCDRTGLTAPVHAYRWASGGTDAADLRKGPGLYPQTPFPCAGGTTANAGHRTTYAAPFR
jgi:glucose/arabinose dehydrogenase